MDGGGLLIDWDMCKEKDGNEGQMGKYRTSRTVRVNSWCLDLIDAKLGPQGTWPFMAAELFLSPEIAHSFLHNLESTYFVLLFHGITNIKHTLPKGLAANIFHDILNSRCYGQGGGIQKFFFML